MVASRLVSHFRLASTSVPSRLCTETTKGEKWCRCWRQASKYLQFFSCCIAARLLNFILVIYDVMYMFNFRIYKMQSVTHSHMSRIRTSPLCSDSTSLSEIFHLNLSIYQKNLSHKFKNLYQCIFLFLFLFLFLS